MPTVTFSVKDLESLVGMKLAIEDIQKYAHLGKGDVDAYDKDTDEVKIDFGDTNLPYLWSAEGFARLIKLSAGINKGIPKLLVKKGSYRVNVDKSVGNIRPYIAAFVAKGHKIDDNLIKQIIQLQEKLCENYGMKRQKVAIGIYRHDKISFPIHYKATDPESVEFIPLDYRKPMTQQEILEDHPKGREYAWILKGNKKYPLLVDDKDQVLSFPPIINSEATGKIEEGDENLFFEATGTDLNSVLLATNIFAQALYERGFKIYSAEIRYNKNKITTPKLFYDKIQLSTDLAKKLTGLDLKRSELKSLILKAGYDISGDKIMVAPYRADILHPADLIEDIAIAYGYDNIDEQPLQSHTIGSTSELISFIDKIREIAIGLGYQEIFSPILSNKPTLYDRMNIKDFGTIEIDNFMSEKYSAVRSWLVPILLEFLSVNKHAEYPQNIFEEGLVCSRKADDIMEHHRIALIRCSEKADFTEIKQALDYLFRMLNVEYKIEETIHGSFIQGRTGRVVVDGKKVAYIGEIHPKVLERFGINMPTAAFELNISELYEAIS